MAPTGNKNKSSPSTGKVHEKKEAKRRVPGFVSKSKLKKETEIQRIGGECHVELNKCLTTFITVLTNEALFHLISAGESTLKDRHLELAKEGIRKPTVLC